MTKADQVCLIDALARVEPVRYSLRWSLVVQIVREIEHLCLYRIIAGLYRRSALLIDLILPILLLDGRVPILAGSISIVQTCSDSIRYSKLDH